MQKCPFEQFKEHLTLSRLSTLDKTPQQNMIKCSQSDNSKQDQRKMSTIESTTKYVSMAC